MRAGIRCIGPFGGAAFIHLPIKETIMESENVDESSRSADQKRPAVEMGQVSKETKGAPHAVQESPEIFPGPQA